MGIHDEVRIEEEDFVAGIDHATKGQDESAAGAAGDQQLAVGMLITTLVIRDDLGPQLGDAAG